MISMERRGIRHYFKRIIIKKIILSLLHRGPFLARHQGPHLRTTNLKFNLGFTPLHLLYKREDEPRVEPGVWRPEMWAQDFASPIFA
jgi:hypothetical protein